MKVALKKRNEGRKAETKTSDKENESVQRKWPRGAAPVEESPTAWCFLSSQRQSGRQWQLAKCPMPLSPPHLRPEAAGGFGKEDLLHPSTNAEPRTPRLEAGWTTSCWVLLRH